ncbi:MAG TPA: DUF3017 domain-containing protein [Kineosporiaceae bacterium]|nr:DUF3017 domain-containing protein [Kineosporiaceae bacterium]
MIHWEVPPTRRIAFVVVLLVVAASVLATTFVDFRLGGYLLAGALGLAAAMRAVLPARFCLGLLVRSRQFDVLIAVALAAAIAVVVNLVPSH